MNKNLIILSLIAVLGVSCSVDDNSSPKPEDVFIKYYGVSGLQKAVDVIFNESKNEYFILATQDLGEEEGKNFYYITTDAGGNLLSQDTVNFKDTLGVSLIDEAVRLKRIDDDNYLIVGTSTNADEQSHIVWGKVSHDLVQQEYFKVENSTEPYDLTGSDIILVENGTKVIILGTTSLLYPGDLADPSTADETIFLIQTKFF